MDLADITRWFMDDEVTGANEYSPAKIALLRVYDRPLTAGEVADLANNPFNEGTLVLPQSYAVTQGSELSGNLPSLMSSDDDCLAVFPDEFTLQAQVIIDGVSPIASPTRLRFTLESSVGRFGLGQVIRLRNFVSNNWTAVDGRVASTSDFTVSATLTATAPNHVRGDGLMRAEITWGPINDEDPSQDGWIHCIDLATWRVN
jgi:hypothetical protein